MLGACVIDEVQDLDSAEGERRRKSELEDEKSGQRNPKKNSQPKADVEGGL